MSKKDQFLQIRMTPAEKAAIKKAATRSGLDMSRWVLNQLLPSRQQQFQRIVRAAGEDPSNRRYVLAELNDFLSSLGPAALRAAVAEPPAAALEPFVANYVAAMIETAAHERDVVPPAWTAEIPALQGPVFGTTLMGLRLHLLMHSPPAFRRRNIFVDASVGDRV